MIKVSGEAMLRVPYEVELDMTESEFNGLSDDEANDVLEGSIDWKNACRSAETDNIDIWDIEEDTTND
jgi:hypothetical protein